MIKIKTTVGGLIFYPEVIPDNFFTSVREWLDAGSPSESFIHDLADVILMCDIPVVDSVESNGKFFRSPKVGLPKKCIVNIDKSCLFARVPAVSTHKVLGVMGSNTKDHHKLHY